MSKRVDVILRKAAMKAVVSSGNAADFSKVIANLKAMYSGMNSKERYDLLKALQDDDAHAELAPEFNLRKRPKNKLWRAVRDVCAILFRRRK